MRDIRPGKTYRKDVEKHKKSGVYIKDALQENLDKTITMIQDDEELPASYNNHLLKGNFKGIYDCHIHNDLLLLYNIETENELKLVRLGTHAQLFGKKNKQNK